MIKVTDATKLALTKLRSRKLRLFITIFISGVLFSSLFLSTFIFRGFINDVENFNKEGFASRYILAAQETNINSDMYSSNETIQKRAEEIQKDLVNRKKIEAKKIGIEYDPKTEPPLITTIDSPDGKIKYLEATLPSAKLAIDEYATKNPKPGLSELKKQVGEENILGSFTINQFIQSTDSPKLKVIKDDKESFEPDTNNPSLQDPNSIDNFNLNWTLISNELLEPFIVDKSLLKDNEIPIVLPAKTIEGILKIEQLPSSSSSQDRLDRLKQIREKSKDLTFKVCFRNNESSNNITNAIESQKNLELSQKDKTIPRPEVIYGLPEDPCGVVVTKEDKRTKEQKNTTAKQEKYDKIFGKQEPAQQLITFRVIGISPSADYLNLSDVRSLIGSILGSNLGNPSSFFTPSEYAEKNPFVKSAFFGKSIIEKSESYAVEFKNASSAKEALDNKQCTVIFAETQDQAIDSQEECKKQGNYFVLFPFGSSSLAITEIKSGFVKLFNVAGIIVAVLAFIIMIGTVGRTIADSRRETAVFRAIGAKRIDISSIYIIFTICLSLLIIAFSITLALLLSFLIADRYVLDFTNEALIAYNAQDLSRKFTLFQIYPPDLIKLFGLVILAGLLSVSFPLLRNVRRNPINDMRDEN